MSKILSESEIAEIKKRADAASPGPWEPHRTTDDVGRWLMAINMPKGKKLYDGYAWVSTDREAGSEWNNAEFIGASRTDIPALIASHEELRSKVGPYGEFFSEQLKMIEAKLETAVEALEVIANGPHVQENIRARKALKAIQGEN